MTTAEMKAGATAGQSADDWVGQLEFWMAVCLAGQWGSVSVGSKVVVSVVTTGCHSVVPKGYESVVLKAVMMGTQTAG